MVVIAKGGCDISVDRLRVVCMCVGTCSLYYLVELI
jgi:hypothetical protein